MLIPGAPGMIVAEGCTLDRCYRADCKVSPGCMQGAGPKVPGSDSVAAEGVAHSLRTGYQIFRQGIESWLVCRNNVGQIGRAHV